jgi:hypothetical protein
VRELIFSKISPRTARDLIFFAVVMFSGIAKRLGSFSEPSHQPEGHQQAEQ